MLTQETYNEWKGHPATKEVFGELAKIKINLMTALSQGQTLSGDASETQRDTAMIIGQIQGINQVLHITFEGE
ncbi:MAG: hypothetical protein U9N82_03455 [Thermodesulfobacteriota bacterium]|nr:hypothetical protein [Thermodesulfobacteriota bacterium]